jgi:hypothetical protein
LHWLARSAADASNPDLFYVDVLRRSLDRLNARVAPVGEPIPLDDTVMRRFANTFLQQIARPGEIDWQSRGAARSQALDIF